MDQTDDEKPKNDGDSNTQESEDGRRKTLRKILVGGGVISASGMVPEKWTSTVVESVVLPVHAQTSNLANQTWGGVGPAPGSTAT